MLTRSLLELRLAGRAVGREKRAPAGHAVVAQRAGKGGRIQGDQSAATGAYGNVQVELRFHCFFVGFPVGAMVDLLWLCSPGFLSNSRLGKDHTIPNLLVKKA